MSTLQWDGHRIIQSVGSKNASAELGYVSYDKYSKKYVLWLNSPLIKWLFPALTPR